MDENNKKYIYLWVYMRNQNALIRKKKHRKENKNETKEKKEPGQKQARYSGTIESHKYEANLEYGCSCFLPQKHLVC